MTKAEKSRDQLDPARANALLIALGRDGVLRQGSVLPPFFHQLYFWTPEPPTRLGRDGHPKVGLGLVPDFGLPRRMWAGGRLKFETPLKVGEPAERITVLESAARKSGRTGPLSFVTLRHEFVQDGKLCLTEWQDLVYREDPHPGATRPTPPAARSDETDRVAVSFTSTLLFRYSALTFNGHRIHYDLDYARDVEGYGGLVVHGPLLAQHLMLMAEQVAGPLKGFSFRAMSPLMHHESATLCRAGTDLWVRAADGRQCMIASMCVGH